MGGDWLHIYQPSADSVTFARTRSHMRNRIVAAWCQALLVTEEAAVLAAMPAGDELAVNALIEATGLPSSAVTAALFKLELRRLIRPLPGFRFIRR